MVTMLYIPVNVCLRISCHLQASLYPEGTIQQPESNPLSSSWTPVAQPDGKRKKTCMPDLKKRIDQKDDACPANRMV